MEAAAPNRRVRRSSSHLPLQWGEGLLWLLVIGVPLAIGGVHPSVLAAVGVVGGLALACVAWGRGRDGVPAPAAAIGLFLGAVAALVTICPLPAGLAGFLSPRARTLAVFPPEAAPSWIRLSLDPPATLVDLPRLAGLAAILLAAAALSRRAEVARRLAAAIGLAGVGVVLVAAVHSALGLTELYGFYPARFENDPVSPFINGNHAASLALLGLLACLGVARTARERLPRLLWYSGAAGCLVFGMSTHSNGGIGAILIALVLYVLLSARRAAKQAEVPGRLMRWTLAAIGLALVAIVASLAGVLEREGLEALSTSAASKIRSWPATLHLIRDSWLTGVGRGAFGAAFPPYAPPRTISTVTHPENLVLHWLAEWGVPAALVGFFLLGLTLWLAWRRSDQAEELTAPIQDALLAAVVGVLLHDLADFGLEFAGVGVPFTVALGVLAGRTAGAGRVRRLPWLVATTAMVSAVVAFMQGRPHLADAELAALAGRENSVSAEVLNREYREVRHRHPADPQVVIDAADALLARSAMTSLPQPERVKAMELALQYLVRAQSLSQQEQPHLGLAWALARLGRRSQAFTELRLAFAVSASLRAIDQAVSYGASAEELASFPAALANSRLASPDHNASLAPPHAAAALVGYLAVEKGRPRLADETAQEILQLPAMPELPHTAELFEAACRVEYMDGDCALRLGPGQRGGACGTRADVPEVAARVVQVGREWLQRYPADPRAYSCLAEGYMLLGADEEAQRMLADATDRLPDSQELKVALASWMMRRHRPTEALAVLQEIAGDGDPATAPQVRGLRAQALWDSGHRAQARTEAETATRLFPDALWAWRLAGTIHEQNGQFEAALRDVSAAERLASEGEKPGLAAWERRLSSEKEQAGRAAETALTQP